MESRSAQTAVTPATAPVARAHARRSTWFKYQYVDANREALAEASGTTAATFATVGGEVIKAEIGLARSVLELDAVFGCAPRRYFRNVPFEEENSAWRLLLTEVLPVALFEPAGNPAMVAVESTGGLRCADISVFGREQSREPHPH
jgi:hypothetical protein